MRSCVIEVYGMPFQQLRMDFKISTRVSEVKETIGNLFQVDPEKLYFFVKDGKYFRCQREAEEMHQQTFVKGIYNFKREFIPEIVRNVRLPAWDGLPFKLRKNFPPPAPKTPTVRVYVFYGSADSFAQWAHFYAVMPPWVDCAIYEWPGHGSRKDETLPVDVDGLVDDAYEGLKDSIIEHAEGGGAEEAPFAFVGHSIGALVMLGVAERIYSKHKVHPWTVIVLDRAAPHVPMCSEYGAELMRNDPQKFNLICNPTVRNFGDTEEERRMFKMWQDEIQFNEDTKAKGFHIFECPIHIAVASHNYGLDNEEIQKLIPPEELKVFKERDAIFASREGSQAMFDRSTFDEWSAWTDFEAKVYDLPCDHFSLKMDERFLWFLLETLGSLRKNGRPKKQSAAESAPQAVVA
uniref:Thioesterase domain-containing protein n=1 Tax=Alexandrium catenella TaxID=2925 RepID=A0A7S1QXP5_ALECA